MGKVCSLALSMTELLILAMGLSVSDIVKADASTPPKSLPLDYRDAAHWVCRSRPGSACGDDLTTTELLRDGSTRTKRFKPAEAPEADCFYVYPTVSLSKGLTAVPVVTEAERRAVREQAERMTSVCRLFAPIYRQVTVASMKPGFLKPTDIEDRAASEMAEGDVLAAWDDYMAHDNHGRPVVLIGHSQGSFMVIALIKKRLDGYPVKRQLVSAIIPGVFVLVPKGKTVGGTFRTIPPCRANSQIGCVIAFNTVRAERPLPPDMRPQFGDMEQVCTNPASLSGGAGTLKPYLSTTGETIIPDFTAPQPRWMTDRIDIETPFVITPHLYVAECRTDEHGALLAVTTQLGRSDRRTGALTGDWTVDGKVEPTMGLHLIDLNLTAGNLIDVLRLQIATMPRRRTNVRSSSRPTIGGS